MNGSLVQDAPGENDYTLKADEMSCWITVDDLSVYVVRMDGGVSVEIYPHWEEFDDAIASTYALNQDRMPEA